MKKHHILRTVLLSTVFALLAIAFMAPVANAHMATPVHRAATTTSLVPASVPNVNILIKHGKAVFSSTVVHCNAHDLTNPCFALTNRTNVPQQLVIQGHPSVILRPDADLKFFVGTGVVSFSLQSNPHAHLTVISS